MSNTIFYASDHHFFHELARKRSRSHEFSCIEEMNERIIDNHNKKVSIQDEVYLLGDIIVCDENNLDEYMKMTVGRLKGHLHLIAGNHDYKWLEKEAFRSYFESIEQAAFVRDNKHLVQLYHYPILNWYRKGKGSYHIHGHLHNETKGEEIQFLCHELRAFSACVEINGYFPCTLKELDINNKKFKEQVLQLSDGQSVSEK